MVGSKVSARARSEILIRINNNRINDGMSAEEKNWHGSAWIAPRGKNLSHFGKHGNKKSFSSVDKNISNLVYQHCCYSIINFVLSVCLSLPLCVCSSRSLFAYSSARTIGHESQWTNVCVAQIEKENQIKPIIMISISRLLLQLNEQENVE